MTTLIFAATAVFVHAEAPKWWAERGVTNDNPPDDFAAVNQGQVKHIAKQAYEEMKSKLPGGAGPSLDGVWSNPAISIDDYAVINLGQLKTVAAPFYGRLIKLHLAKEYPWVTTNLPADDFAIANIGQVKALFAFSFDFFTDTNSNGIFDVWEYNYFDQLLLSPQSTNGDADELTDWQEYLLGTNPRALAENAGASVLDMVIHTP